MSLVFSFSPASLLSCFHVFPPVILFLFAFYSWILFTQCLFSGCVLWCWGQFRLSLSLSLSFSLPLSRSFSVSVYSFISFFSLPTLLIWLERLHTSCKHPQHILTKGVQQQTHITSHHT